MRVINTAGPELKRYIQDQLDKPTYNVGFSFIHLTKSALEKEAGEATLTYSLAGRLYLSKNNWLLLSVPNSLVRGAFDALHEIGAELPLNDGKLNAHVSVMNAEEVEKIGPNNITEKGHLIHYTLGALKEVKPSSWPEVSKVWFIEIKSPELQNLRKSYGLSPLMREDHQFHITVAKRRKYVLQNNDVTKVEKEPFKKEALDPNENDDLKKEYGGMRLPVIKHMPFARGNKHEYPGDEVSHQDIQDVLKRHNRRNDFYSVVPSYAGQGSPGPGKLRMSVWRADHENGEADYPIPNRPEYKLRIGYRGTPRPNKTEPAFDDLPQPREAPPGERVIPSGVTITKPATPVESPTPPAERPPTSAEWLPATNMAVGAAALGGLGYLGYRLFGNKNKKKAELSNPTIRKLIDKLHSKERENQKPPPQPEPNKPSDQPILDTYDMPSFHANTQMAKAAETYRYTGKVQSVHLRATLNKLLDKYKAKGLAYNNARNGDAIVHVDSDPETTQKIIGKLNQYLQRASGNYSMSKVNDNIPLRDVALNSDGLKQFFDRQGLQPLEGEELDPTAYMRHWLQKRYHLAEDEATHNLIGKVPDLAYKQLIGEEPVYQSQIKHPERFGPQFWLKDKLKPTGKVSPDNFNDLVKSSEDSWYDKFLGHAPTSLHYFPGENRINIGRGDEEKEAAIRIPSIRPVVAPVANAIRGIPTVASNAARSVAESAKAIPAATADGARTIGSVMTGKAPGLPLEGQKLFDSTTVKPRLELQKAIEMAKSPDVNAWNEAAKTSRMPGWAARHIYGVDPLLRAGNYLDRTPVVHTPINAARQINNFLTTPITRPLTQPLLNKFESKGWDAAGNKLDQGQLYRNMFRGVNTLDKGIGLATRTSGTVGAASLLASIPDQKRKWEEDKQDIARQMQDPFNLFGSNYGKATFAYDSDAANETYKRINENEGKIKNYLLPKFLGGEDSPLANTLRPISQEYTKQKLFNNIYKNEKAIDRDPNSSLIKIMRNTTPGNIAVSAAQRYLASPFNENAIKDKAVQSLLENHQSLISDRESIPKSPLAQSLLEIAQPTLQSPNVVSGNLRYGISKYRHPLATDLDKTLGLPQTGQTNINAKTYDLQNIFADYVKHHME